MSLLFNMLSRLVITFLPRSKRILISWLQSPSPVILEPPKIKSFIVSIVSPSVCHEVMELDAIIFIFGILSFKPAFSPSSFTFIKRLFSSSLLSAIRVVLSAYRRLLIFLLQSWFQLLLHPVWHLVWCTLVLSWERICLQFGRPGLDPWVGKIPWRRARLPTPVFWPGDFHGLYSSWGRQESDILSDLHFHFHSA